jgi:hypothetical protein
LNVPTTIKRNIYYIAKTIEHVAIGRQQKKSYMEFREESFWCGRARQTSRQYFCRQYRPTHIMARQPTPKSNSEVIVFFKETIANRIDRVFCITNNTMTIVVKGKAAVACL